MGDLVFDNNWPDGISLSSWLKDLGGDTYIGKSGSGSMMELVEEAIGSPFNCAR